MKIHTLIKKILHPGQPRKNEGSLSDDKLARVVEHFDQKAIESRKKALPNLIFISYRNKHIIVARSIAEALMSMGYNVWIDEYMMPIVEFGKFFWERIDEGIAICSKAILLTSSLYWESVYCAYEAYKLTGKINDKNGLLNIKCLPQASSKYQTEENQYQSVGNLTLDTNQLVDKLLDYLNMEWKDSINTLLKDMKGAEFIDKMQEKLECNTKAESEHRIIMSKANISFDINGWIPKDISKIRKVLPIGQQFPQYLYQKHVNQMTLAIHILESQVEKKQRPQDVSEHTIDDREIFEENLSAAQSYLRASGLLQHNIQIVGVHSIPLLNLRHFAITYFINSNNSQPILMRKYILTFPAVDNNCDIEVVITVRVSGNLQVDLKQFLHYMPLFDEFVYSAEYAM